MITYLLFLNIALCSFSSSTSYRAVRFACASE